MSPVDRMAAAWRDDRRYLIAIAPGSRIPTDRVEAEESSRLRSPGAVQRIEGIQNLRAGATAA